MANSGRKRKGRSPENHRFWGFSWGLVSELPIRLDAVSQPFAKSGDWPAVAEMGFE